MSAFPQRSGPRPTTTSVIPHSQSDQQPVDDRHLSAVLAEAATWQGVLQGPSRISVPGARALLLADDVPTGPAEAFFVGREFCHGHAQGDRSLHLALPLSSATELEAAGWVEPHFLALAGTLPRNLVMLYAPRDEDEAAVALDIIRASYEFAVGARP